MTTTQAYAALDRLETIRAELEEQASQADRIRISAGLPSGGMDVGAALEAALGALDEVHQRIEEGAAEDRPQSVAFAV